MENKHVPVMAKSGRPCGGQHLPKGGISGATQGASGDAVKTPGAPPSP